MPEIPYPLNQGGACRHRLLCCSCHCLCCVLPIFAFWLCFCSLRVSCSTPPLQSWWCQRQSSLLFCFCQRLLMPSHAQTRKGILLSAFRLSVFRLVGICFSIGVCSIAPTLLLCLASLFLVMFFRPSCVWLRFISSFLVLSSLSFFPCLVACLLLRSFLFGVSSRGDLLAFFLFVCGVSSVAFECTLACVSYRKTKKKKNN
jgi:hypothetical protein